LIVKVISGEAMNKDEKTVDSILTRLFITTLKIEEKAIAAKFNNALSISELHVLREIDVGDFMTMTQVAKGLKSIVGALTTAMNKLEKKGYVIRERDRDDKRIVKIRLTDEGKEAFVIHEDFHKKMVDAAISALTPEEKNVLLKSLSNVDEYFIEEWKKCRS
jgi:DNA-binding MarR family transcriptional regulator